MSHDTARQPGPEEAIRRIQEADSEGRHIVRNAREQEAAQILQDAQEAAQKSRDGILAQAREKARQQREALLAQAQAEAEKIHAESEQDAASLRKAAGSLVPEAVARTAEKIAGLIRRD